MPDVLIYGDSVRSPELRHEVPALDPGPVPLRREGRRRAVVVSSLEIPRVARGGARARGHPARATSASTSSARRKAVRRRSRSSSTRARAGARHHGRRRAADVPARARRPPARERHRAAASTASSSTCGAGARTRPSSPGSAARSARARPRSTPRARCCAARRANGALVLDGEPLTCERLKREIERVFTEHGVVADEFIVAHGAQTAIGHEMGSGQILAGRADRRSTSSRATARPAASPT